ncbi:hypothetical protein [Pseudofrankia sp. BMG5.37]|nr:hypothetical protein [Pseudofrankia sp. BMG5.37]MDT3444545.1 hypothetical protein [Pseudofrankia sp. BMG5.37]
MTVPRITGGRLAGRPHQPLLVVGPSLGTSSTALWATAAGLLGDTFHVVGWDLPGHGAAPVHGPFTIGELAAGVLAYVEEVAAARGDGATQFAYAGVSLGPG